MQDLHQRIVDTFPLVVVATKEVEGIPPESFDYAKTMGGKDWTGVSEEIYETYTDALTLMAPKTLRHFIAGYLSVASETTNSMSAESLVYAATQGENLDNLCAVLTLDQITCLFEVIEYVFLDNYGYEDEKEYLQILANKERFLSHRR